MTTLTIPVSSSESPASSSNETTLLEIATDFTIDGRPETQRLEISSKRLTVYGESVNGNAPVFELAISDAASFRTVAGFGSGLLQAKVGDLWLDVIRFSNRHATRFHKVARLLERVREANLLEPEERETELCTLTKELQDETLDSPRCKTCSLRLQTAEESCPRCMEKGQIIRHVVHLLKPHRKGALFLCGLTVLGVIAELIPPKLQQYMVDHILNGQTVAETVGGSGPVPTGQVPFQAALPVVVLALAFSRVLLSAVGIVKGQIATAIGTGLTSTLRSDLVQKLQKMAVAYYDRHQVGSMLSRVAHDSEVLHGLIHQLTGGFLLQIVQLLGVGAMLLWLNPKLAMFTLIPVPLVFLGSWIFWRKVYPRYYRLWDASSRQMSVLGGMLQGIRVVKAFAQEGREFERFKKSSEHLRQWRLWVENTNAWYSASMSMVFSLGGLIVWYVGGRDVIGQDMSLGELIAFLAYLAMFYAPLGALSNFTSWLTSFLSGSKRVLELLETPLGVNDSKDSKAWNNPRGHIRFENVTFGYDRNQPVIKDVSFEVAPGEMVGIVGRSGSGKTTMVNLLGRFYDVQEGKITVDGHDIRQLSMQSLREHLGIVFQDSFLFRGTIWKNLSYGRPQTDIEQAIVAAKAAGAHDFILRQGLGYETLLGEHGAGLSGGEKQRLSIARTLLYDPTILVLDEATSNIDAEAEKSIQEALEVLIRGRTTVAIAHRLSTLRNADRILVFDRGRLIEQGTHAELLSTDGTYARLVRIQTQVTKTPTVDKLLWNAESKESEPSDVGAESNESQSDDMKQESQETKSKGPSIQWLEPATTELRQADQGRTELWVEGALVSENVFSVAAFPATRPNQFLSIRRWKDHGEDEELGMVRSVDEWPAEQQSTLLTMTNRRYLLRNIVGIESVKLRLGFLDFEAMTEFGPEKFTMRWTQSQAIDFGDAGKLLIDTEDNRYVVKNVEGLKAADREKFLQYIYW